MRYCKITLILEDEETSTEHTLKWNADEKGRLEVARMISVFLLDYYDEYAGDVLDELKKGI